MPKLSWISVNSCTYCNDENFSARSGWFRGRLQFSFINLTAISTAYMISPNIGELQQLYWKFTSFEETLRFLQMEKWKGVTSQHFQPAHSLWCGWFSQKFHHFWECVTFGLKNRRVLEVGWGRWRGTQPHHFHTRPTSSGDRVIPFIMIRNNFVYFYIFSSTIQGRKTLTPLPNKGLRPTRTGYCTNKRTRVDWVAILKIPL